ncbi:DNA mismatch repair protein Msh3-like isoform X3 [Pomacea canaliculata]|uniref:DNA mismatch repair protein Msh3-like isoform X3 n=1 Tax=Pomacea canaliculata TaxID=400727 RepID=UPI000D738337|nr:DNA mismatch repair protein Msh3-like isoform X3 [Pomacea canaliculata]
MVQSLSPMLKRTMISNHHHWQRHSRSMQPALLVSESFSHRSVALGHTLDFKVPERGIQETPDKKGKKRKVVPKEAKPQVSKKPRGGKKKDKSTSPKSTEQFTSLFSKSSVTCAASRESASVRLQEFALREESSRDASAQRTLWKPKHLPDVLSHDQSQEEDMSVQSGSESGDESQGVSDFTANSSIKEGKDKSKCAKTKRTSKAGPSKMEKLSAFIPVASSHFSSSFNKPKKPKFTPLEQQYLEIKEKYPDAILLVECGYKYRFFGTDAEIAAKELKIFCHPNHNFMTASIPVHRLFVHVRRLVAAGYKVGVVKQTETAALKAAGDNRNAPFTRRLTALYTKSTLIGEDVDQSSSVSDFDGVSSVTEGLHPNSYLMCVYDFPSDSRSKNQQQIAMVAVDPATSDIVFDSFLDGESRQELETRISHIQPVEVLISVSPTRATDKLIQSLVAISSTADDRIRVESMEEEKFSYGQAFETVSNFYSSVNVRGLQDVLALPKPVVCCVGALITYLKDFNLQNILALTSNFHQFSSKSKYLHLPAACLRNLEIFQNATNGSEHGSLFWLLDNTVSRFGKRLLKSWVAQPLRTLSDIKARQDAVQDLCTGKTQGLKRLQESLARAPDLERGLCSIYHNKSSATEFVSVAKSLSKLCQEIHLLQTTDLTHIESTLLKQVLTEVPDLLEDVKDFADTINEKAARENKKADLFVDNGRFPEITEVKKHISDVLQEIRDHRREIRLALRQPSLDYTTVMQTEFLVEVKNTQLHTVPADWTKISSTKMVTRFHPPFVVAKYKQLNQLKEKLIVTVTDCWQKFLREFSEGFVRYRKGVQLIASLDAFMSLAKVAMQDGYCRPEVINDAVMIEVENGRHPVIDSLKREQEQYVPNSTSLNADAQRVMVVTGPNMGGKSSYIRQVALISVMTQIGSFVPATSARLGILDAIFTRMGAEDEIFKGRSTFMVELQEAAEILTAATSRSLVIMDELGRGTSTHDGVAIAYATLRHFITMTRCLTLFVTHYPLLAEFQALFPATVGNFHMAFLLYDGSSGNTSQDKNKASKDDGNMDSEDTGDEEVLTFLYQLTPGAAGKSYGLNVARLAHIPRSILDVATTMSHQLEEQINQRRQAREKFASLFHATTASNIKEVFSGNVE